MQGGTARGYSSAVPSRPPRLVPILRLRPVLLSLAALSAVAGAQEPAPAGSPPLAPFAALRVAVTPVQFWRPDSVGWSAGADGATLRAAVDSLIGETLRERGLGARWAYAADVERSARRNPLYASDPRAIGVGRWRTAPPKVGDALPPVVADNLRSITALGDTRHALIPVELRGEGELAILRLVLVDTRTRTVVWGADIGTVGGAATAAALADRLADLIIEP